MTRNADINDESARTSESSAVEVPEDELQTRVSNYRAAVENLPNHGERNCKDAVLTLLLARDELANAIHRSPHLTNDLVTEMSGLDEQVKANAHVMFTCAGSKTFQNWRDLFQPPESAWWWFLDKRVSDSEKARMVVWVLLTGFAVTLTISITADISSRFLVGVPDKLSILSTAAQVFLALVAGSSFTQAGREWAARLLAAFHLRPKLQPLFGFLLSLIIVLVTIGFRYSLPSIASYYNQRGAQSYQENKGGAALEDFKRAVALNPDNSEAQYNLAYAHENIVFDYEKAMAGYQKAVELRPDFDAAYNNLAHLYLLYRSDYKRALDILSRIFSKPITDTDLKYAAYKNRAWAFIGQEQFDLADRDLLRALEIKDGAQIHCMRGQALSGQGKKEDALVEWSKCLEMIKEDSKGVEPYWQAVAITGIRKE